MMRKLHLMYQKKSIPVADLLLYITRLDFLMQLSVSRILL